MNVCDCIYYLLFIIILLSDKTRLFTRSTKSELNFPITLYTGCINSYLSNLSGSPYKIRTLMVEQKHRFSIAIGKREDVYRTIYR